MTASTPAFADLEARVAAGEALTPADAARLLSATDLIAIGALGEMARKARHGDRVTYGRVCAVEPGPQPADRGDAGEVRLEGTPASIDEARARVHAAAHLAVTVPLTGFSAADLVALAGHDHLALAEVARALAAAGLDAVAALPLDRLGETENAVEVVRAIRHGGLGVWRATIDRAAFDDRLTLIERAASLQRELGGLLAFAPLPRLDPPDAPSTGYDDVRTIAVARLVCRDIPAIQVDWQVYGPKLAQVAITYGADDIDNIRGVDTLNLGQRRSPREDIERQIRAAFATPVERTGRYDVRS